jgi:photosystem II stability/assembly factor-like uncharacterized protein
MIKIQKYGYCIIWFWSLLGAQEWKVITPSFLPVVTDTPLYRKVQFFNDQQGWLFGTVDGKHCAWYTQDCAASWFCKLTDNTSTRTWVSMRFVKPSHGTILFHVVGRNYVAGIHKTTDYGATWTTDSPIHKFTALYYIDTLYGVANTIDTIFRTTDGGKTWNPQAVNCPYRFTIQKYFFVNPAKGWAIGINCSILDEELVLQTQDSGKTWITSLGQSFPLTGIYFSNENRGYISGTYSMQQTVNGGKTWSIKGPAGQDVFFTDERAGWCIGSNGAIRQTLDSGSTWQLVQHELLNNEQAIFKSITFTPSGNTGFICGHNGYILKYTTSSKINYVPTYSTNCSRITTPLKILGYRTDVTAASPFFRYFDLAGRQLSPEGLQTRHFIPFLWVRKGVE